MNSISGSRGLSELANHFVSHGLPHCIVAAAAPLHTVPLVSSSMTILPHALWKPALEVVAFVGVVRLGLRQLETREKEEDDDASSDESRYPWYR